MILQAPPKKSGCLKIFSRYVFLFFRWKLCQNYERWHIYNIIFIYRVYNMYFNQPIWVGWKISIFVLVVGFSYFCERWMFGWIYPWRIHGTSLVYLPIHEWLILKIRSSHGWYRILSTFPQNGCIHQHISTLTKRPGKTKPQLVTIVGDFNSAIIEKICASQIASFDQTFRGKKIHIYIYIYRPGSQVTIALTGSLAFFSRLQTPK